MLQNKFNNNTYYYKLRYLSLVVKVSFCMLGAIVVLSALSRAAYADPMDKVSPFTEGSSRVTLIFGHGKGYGNTYAIYGLGVAYYIQDGLEVGIDIEDWTGGSPHITRVSPEIRYVFYWTPNLSPYAGLFYQQDFVSGRNDVDYLGVRAGFNFTLSERVYIGIGMVYDSALNCSRNCSDTYPEILAAFTF
jgi:hypothetical protein